MNFKPIVTEIEALPCSIVNDSMFSLDDIFKLSGNKNYWYREYRKYLNEIKEPDANIPELSTTYKECIKMVNLSRVLRLRRKTTYYARINTHELAGPYQTLIAAHNRAFKEKE